MKSKKKGLRLFISNFETYTRYSWVADEEQKKVLGILNVSSLSSHVGWGNGLFDFFKGGNLKKKCLGNPGIEHFIMLKSIKK